MENQTHDAVLEHHRVSEADIHDKPLRSSPVEEPLDPMTDGSSEQPVHSDHSHRHSHLTGHHRQHWMQSMATVFRKAILTISIGFISYCSLLYFFQDVLIYPIPRYDAHYASLLQRHMLPRDANISGFQTPHPRYPIIPLGYMLPTPLSSLSNSPRLVDHVEWDVYNPAIVTASMAADGTAELPYPFVSWYVPPFVDAMTPQSTFAPIGHGNETLTVSCAPPDSIIVLSGGNAMAALDWISYIDQDYLHLAGYYATLRLPSAVSPHMASFLPTWNDMSEVTLPKTPLRVAYLLVDPPGYGMNSGTPNPQSTQLNMMTALSVLSLVMSQVERRCMVRQTAQIPTTLAGFSLGCASSLYAARAIEDANTLHHIHSTKRDLPLADLTNAYNKIDTDIPLVFPGLSRFQVNSIVLTAPFSSLLSLVTRILPIPGMLATTLLRHNYRNDAVFLQISQLRALQRALHNSNTPDAQQMPPPTYIVHSIHDNIVPVAEGIDLFSAITASYTTNHPATHDIYARQSHHDLGRADYALFQPFVDLLVGHHEDIHLGDARVLVKHMFPQSPSHRNTKPLPAVVIGSRSQNTKLVLLQQSTHNHYFSHQMGNLPQYSTFFLNYGVRINQS